MLSSAMRKKSRGFLLDRGHARAAATLDGKFHNSLKVDNSFPAQSSALRHDALFRRGTAVLGCARATC